MAGTIQKEEAHRLVDGMPDNATWDDLIYEIHVRAAIESGLADLHEGRTVDMAEVLAEHGFSE